MKDKKCCPVCPVTVLLAYAAYIVTSYIVHGILMQGVYFMNPELWAKPAMMKHNIPFYYVGAFLFSISATLIFKKGYEGKNPADEGVRFGLLFGLAMAALKISVYPFGKVPMEVVVCWGIGDIFQMIIVGLVLATCYSKKCKATMCCSSECSTGMCETEVSAPKAKVVAKAKAAPKKKAAAKKKK